MTAGTPVPSPSPVPWQDLSDALSAGRAPDRVEIKAVLAPQHPKQVISALGADTRAAQRRQVYFLDTHGLSLHRRGVVVRIRKIGRRGADIVVKVRRRRPFELASRRLRFPNLVVELDALPTSVVWSAAISCGVRRGIACDVVAGERPVVDLLTPEQRALLRVVVPGVDLARLTVLGPVTVLKARTRRLGAGDRPTVEIWRYPGGARLVEVSTKCSPRHAGRVAAATARALRRRGVPLADVQESKTGATLALFAARAAA